MAGRRGGEVVSPMIYLFTVVINCNCEVGGSGTRIRVIRGEVKNSADPQNTQYYYIPAKVEFELRQY